MIIEGNVFVFVGAIMVALIGVDFGVKVAMAFLEKRWGLAAFNAIAVYGAIIVAINVWSAA